VKSWSTEKFGEEVAVALAHDFFRLLNCETLQAYENLKEAYCEKWPRNFLVYYNSHIEEAALKSGRWVLENLNAYKKDSGVILPLKTINHITKSADVFFTYK